MTAQPDAVVPDARDSAFPLGATILPDGVNFSVFSRQASSGGAVAVR